MATTAKPRPRPLIYTTPPPGTGAGGRVEPTGPCVGNCTPITQPQDPSGSPNGTLGGLLAALAGSGGGSAQPLPQTLVEAPTSGSTLPWVGILLTLAAIGLGWYWWKHRGHRGG